MRLVVFAIILVLLFLIVSGRLAPIVNAILAKPVTQPAAPSMSGGGGGVSGFG